MPRYAAFLRGINVGMSGVTAALGSNTVRTMGTIEQIATKCFAG